MKKFFKLFLMVASCSILTACTFGGGTVKPSNNEEADGGQINNTDYSAPKTIESTELVEFSTEFFLYDKYDDNRSTTYSFRIVKDEGDTDYYLIATGDYNVKAYVDESIFDGIQEIIEEYQLAKSNGIDQVTAGLAPEYAPMFISAEYASGEKLYFRENGNPYSEMTLKIRNYIENYLIEQGNEDVKAAQTKWEIKDFSFDFNIGDAYHSYMIAKDENDEEFLWHYTDTPVTQEEKIVITDSLYKDLQELFEEYDFMLLDENDEEDYEKCEGDYLSVYITYENGYQIAGEYNVGEVRSEWPEMRDALVEYFEAYIAENKVE